ncbi:MAG: hypothetical protein KGZ49_08385 [Syntrophaceae bacterium]|nr:hypothetical protein [Syntrophaceae bacterium]
MRPHREAKKPETCLLNAARLITQEIWLMKITKNPRQAFLRQGKLLIRSLPTTGFPNPSCKQ